MSSDSTHKSLLRRILGSRWSWLFILLALVAVYFIIKISNAIKALEYQLTPPVLPPYQVMQKTEYLNPEGWDVVHDNQWFHHASQGTATVPIPYDWFMALEAPESNPWWLIFSSDTPFVGEYMLRMGFIKSDTEQRLPLGFARTESIYFAGIDRSTTAAGFSCAACHTGQFTHNNTRYVVEGGPAMSDLGLFTRSLGAALGQTALSSQFSILDNRFERFARNVLGSGYNIVTRDQLKTELTNMLAELAKGQDVINVTEGFTRLDALNRIGNKVFSEDTNQPGNYAPINAPVNYPHIWTTSWFDWVQYDGSIMQPLARNSGEALGVAAFVNTDAGKPKNDFLGRFSSSVPVSQLHAIESWIGGTHPMPDGYLEGKTYQFNGIHGPKWPSQLGVIDKQKSDKGAGLYKELCAHCHLPPIESKDFWKDHWYKIPYTTKQGQQETSKPYIKLNIIPLDVINTDPAQANVLLSRTVDTIDLGLNVDVCTLASTGAGSLDPKLDYWGNSYGDKQNKDQAKLTMVPVKDSATNSFALALGAFVQQTNDQWFKQNYTTDHWQYVFEGERPNCLMAGAGYKARPLNGVWATAPFLHNGSIATIYDLLSTEDERPTFVELGNQAFDTKHLGIVQSDIVQRLNRDNNYRVTDDYDKNGWFILDTREPGNFNRGHLFDDPYPNKSASGKKTIGRKLSEDEKLALIEYLKTL